MDRSDKLTRLKEVLNGIGPAAVAYSGGVDSTLLLKVALDELDGSALPVIVAGDLMPRSDIEEAVVTATALGCEPVVIEMDLLSIPEFRRNPPDRCYICKLAIFRTIFKAAAERGFTTVIDGSHGGDLETDRPGMRALREMGVRSPLNEAGLGKEDIRSISRAFSLPTSEKPPSPCLATRIPFGQEVTAKKLSQIDAAERAVKGLGIKVVRVRHYGDLARIEVIPSDIPAVRAHLGQLAPLLKGAGFARVEVDPRGYRSGSLSEPLRAGKGIDKPE